MMLSHGTHLRVQLNYLGNEYWLRLWVSTKTLGAMIGLGILLNRKVSIGYPNSTNITHPNELNSGGLILTHLTHPNDR
nr:hypothetical protein Q903MT_gene3661 [Picea sitchensis]